MTTACVRGYGLALFALMGLCGVAVKGETPVQGCPSRFYRTIQRADARWSFVSPAGEMLFLGVDHVEDSPETASRLKAWGFNALGSTEKAQPKGTGLPWTKNVKIGARLADKSDPEYWLGENLHRPATAFPNVFRADFEKDAFRMARKSCAPLKDDTSLLGYYMDNELAWHGRNRGVTRHWGLFDAACAKPTGNSARVAVEKFLSDRGLSPTGDVPVSVKMDFVRLCATRYFDVCTRAIRAADPNHLILGCRFNGYSCAAPCVFAEAGRFCDVVTLNLYPSADLDRREIYASGGIPLAEKLRETYSWTKRPLLITEWSFPALDAGLSDKGGEGQRFRTQQEREQATELFIRTVHALPFMIGQSYFKWADPQPGSRQMTNYGIVKNDGTFWPGMAALFTRLYEPKSLEGLRRAEVPAARHVEEQTPSGHDEGASGVCFARTGDTWKLETAAGLVLTGCLGKGVPVADCRWKGVSYGRTELGLQVNTGVFAPRVREGVISAWPCTDTVRDVAYDGRSVTVFAQGSCGGQTFEMVLRITPLAADGNLQYEIVSLRNLSDRPLLGMTALLRHFAPFKKVVSPSEGEHRPWKGVESSSLTDGTHSLTARSDAKTLRSLRFHRDAKGGLHPDVIFRPYFGEGRTNLELAPRGTYSPAVPFYEIVTLQ